MKLTRKIALLLLSAAITLGSFSPLTYAQNTNPININTATVVELVEALDGVGEVKATAIVALREQLGSFVNLEQLLEVKGIGSATLLRISPVIVLE
ncbi:MAG: helix-hairpin-helix domain-containing protein [Oceanospirillaceae bacterium]|nr:helix-hairpin-helix domain-containing protein [Oceanospirillaceae bacterium]